MMTFRGLTLQRGDQQLLENCNLSLHAGWKVGLTGANGAGKSSLFKAFLGELIPDAGDLEMPASWRIAHMAQEVSALARPAIDYVMDGDQVLRGIEQGLREAESADDHHRMAELHGQYDAIQGYAKRSEAEQLLAGLGFAEDEFEAPVSHFSGGWRIRLNLARTLFQPSDLLLLDEPTNHLDLDTTLWLEQWLRQYPGTLVMISHDRDVLDHVVDHILHIERQQLTLYRGGYSDFERQRAEQLAQQQAAHEKQQSEIAHMQRFIDRFKAKATKAKAAQSRMKALERMELIAPAHVDSPFSFTFPASDKTSNPLLVLRDAQLGYSTDQPILKQMSQTLLPGQRIGLLGPNGAGKSTLIKSLVGDLPLLSGMRTAGENLSVGYFAQHQLEALDVQASAAMHIQRLSPKASEQSIRNFLGGFGFHGDETQNPVARFSGGEKARLALALIAWQKPNLLLLDEPTNHLDLEMRHALTVALQDFEGAVMVVSHDRYLLKSTVDAYWLVADGQVASFDGDLDDYEQWLRQRNVQARREAKAAPSVSSQTQTQKQERKLDRKAAAQLRAQLKPWKQAVDQAEKQLEQAQQQLADIESQLGDAALYTDDTRKSELQALLQSEGQVRQAVEDAELEWLEASEALEEKEAELQAS
ncbi:ABC transporter ATP-binding protein [Terasakiispira papahanaumokuakeensis]|uniref:Probable ATP-binding protein YheS n=1 Tax=Terasakiispira papahanaumokuakeensis TaxID=197479 RepID=A0A1E2VD39_9GAMM|nr:ATP-binding cassette domain-containing protein [Terasakiispira papahanaumokuakeensis]ODC04909.1 ABC transporter ATP-binding protein [Terasakiispira papahanaumokuakeensis]